MQNNKAVSTFQWVAHRKNALLIPYSEISASLVFSVVHDNTSDGL